MRRNLVGSILLLCVSTASVAAEPAGGLCLEPQRSTALRAAWSSAPGRLGEVARREGVTEAQLLSALPAELSVGADGGVFYQVWQSLQAWPESLTLIERSGQLFEVLGRIPAGSPSEVSRFFNLGDESHGLSGHLRPDLIAALYVTELPGRGRTEYGVQFIDTEGRVAFGVYVPNEQAAAGNETMDAFQATRRLVKKLSRPCP